jgi:hypothetical protein
MKQKKQYPIDAAIKYFYDVEPLKNDLAATVVSRVFLKQERPSFNYENWIYFILLLIIGGSVAYYFSLLMKLSLSPILILLMTTGCLAWISMKEFSVLSKKLLESIDVTKD